MRPWRLAVLSTAWIFALSTAGQASAPRAASPVATPFEILIAVTLAASDDTAHPTAPAPPTSPPDSGLYILISEVPEGRGGIREPLTTYQLLIVPSEESLEYTVALKSEKERGYPMFRMGSMPAVEARKLVDTLRKKIGVFELPFTMEADAYQCGLELIVLHQGNLFVNSIPRGCVNPPTTVNPTPSQRTAFREAWDLIKKAGSRHAHEKGGSSVFQEASLILKDRLRSP